MAELALPDVSGSFAISRQPIDVSEWTDRVDDPSAGAFVAFEGRVRNHADGRQVTSLAYEAYDALAVKEGERILVEAYERFPIARTACVHRAGHLQIGECAVWVGVSSAHRADAFEACRYIIDELKRRIPVWKKEFYAEGDSVWVECFTAEPVATGDD